MSEQLHPNIVAVVVTYNRLDLLRKTIDAINRQTRLVHEVLIVNNDSTDGTTEWLKEQKNLVVINQENTGGSGGFHTGVKQAYERKADWIWMMDDDVEPADTCLEEMMRWSYLSECINPIHIGTDNELLEEERWFEPAGCTIISNFNHSYEHGKKTWFRNVGSFEGMLVSRNIIEKIGLPDIRFFITHDDLIYGYLANKFTNVIVVADAIIKKLPVQKSENGIYGYLYYYHRNFWLLEEYAARELKGFNGYRKRRIRAQFLYAAYKIMKFNDYSSRKKALATLYKAYRDYKQKKAGKTY